MTDKKAITALLLCITMMLYIIPLAAFAAGVSAFSAPIEITKAAVELQDNVYQVALEGQISSLAAYKNISYIITDANGNMVFFEQGTTKMQGKFSLQAAWQNFSPQEDYRISVTMENGGTASQSIDGSFYKEIYCVILEKITSVKALIEECKSVGLEDCAYEELTVGVTEYFLPIINEAYLSGNSTLYNYQADGLLKNLTESEEALNGYLKGTRAQRKITPYQVGDLVADNGVLYTETKDGKKPTFLTGYLIFEEKKPDIAKLKSLGINHLTMEVSLGQCRENLGTVFIVPYGFRGPWQTDPSKYLICSEDTIVAGGKGAARIVSNGPEIGLTTDVQLKADRTYEFGVSILAKNNATVRFGTKSIRITPSAAWQTVTGTYTPSANEKISFSVVSGGAGDGVYADNLYVREVGTQENLVVNGDFERGKIIRSQYGDFCFSVDNGWLEKIREWLIEAEKHNIAVCVALTPHYMPGHIETVSPGVSDTGYNHNGFMIYNPTDNVYNELLKAMYDAAAEVLGDCKALTQFMLANEPSFAASESPYYLPLWQAFLRDKYGSIDNLNLVCGTAYTSFEQIPMPEEVSLTPLYQDYRSFNEGLLTDTFAWQTAYLGEKVPHIETVVKTLQSNNYIKEQYKNANNYENWAEFFEINGCDTLTYYNEEQNSISIRGMWLDYLSSVKKAPIADLESHMLRDGALKDFSPIIPDWIETVLWQGAMHNVYQTVPWLLDNGKWTDLGNTLLVNRPECVTVIGEMNYDLNRLAKEIGILQSKKTPIAMYYSVENRDALNDNPLAMAKVYDVIVKNGENVDFITESNPKELNNGQYKLLVMADVKVISAKMLEEIRGFVTGGGQVVLVRSSEVSKDELLAFNTDGKSQNAQTLKAVKDSATILNSNFLSWALGDSQTLKDKVFDVTDKKVRLVNAYGNDISDCEWSYAAQGAEYLVSITNYSENKNITAYLEVDGKRVSSFTDLRTLTEYDGDITLSPYSPVLLKTNLVRDTFSLQDKTVSSTATVTFEENLDKAMLMLALYKDNKLIDMKSKVVNVSDAESTVTLEKELTESGNYRVTRLLFDENLDPIVEKNDKEFIIK